MQTTQDFIKAEDFYLFLKRSYSLTQTHHDYLKITKQIEREFLATFDAQSQSYLNDLILALRDDLLPWIVDFPKMNQQVILQQLKNNHTHFNTIEKIIGMDEIQYFITLQITEVTPQLISILGMYLQILNKQPVEKQSTHSLDHIQWKEQLIREFYYPLIVNQFEKSYITRINNYYYDLDRAIQQTPKDLNQLTNNLNALRNELNHYILMNDAIKLRWELSYALLELIEDFSEAIGTQDFNLGIHIIEKFHSMWVTDGNRLGGLYPVVEAYMQSVISWLAIYGLAVQLAWYSYYSHEMSPSLNLLSISIGIKLTEHASFENSFFKMPKNKKNNVRRQRRRIFNH